MLPINKRWLMAKQGNSLKISLIASLAITFVLVQSASSQVTDGDESFQAYHGDIGRISAGSSNSQVAPPTVVRQLKPTATAAPPPAAQVLEATPPSRGRHTSRQSHSHGSQQQQHHHNPRTGSRANQATRTRAPIAVSVEEPLSSSPLALTDPSFSQLAAPTAAQFQQPAPIAASYQIPVAPVAPQEPALAHAQRQLLHQHQHQQPAGSFAASTGHAASVAARHSALMAQVAAERQQYGALESFSAPAAQVQPPPTLESQQPTAAASPAASFVDQPEEPQVAPSFDHVLNNGCPHRGVFSYPNKDHCDRYYMCTNGTFTEEACPNGLAYGQMGAVYQHCAYNWKVDCSGKKTAGPVASPGCPWQFGIFPVESAGRCSLDYFVCEWGVPETKRCSPEGLFYDDRIKGCQWADQLGCKSEAVLNFKCPPEDEDNPYWPFPRYYHTKQDVIVCVNEQPRLVHCNEDQQVEPSSLACIDLYPKKKKKQF